MQNRTPVARESRPPIPDFAPVPRKFRHDGWTPERQRAFIEALADTGSVSRAAAMVNMAQANCYTLRRAPGAEGFRRAWEAALDFGVQRLKDIAFERAIEGQLSPVFVAGKLLGFRRVRNDRLLMFCLRHYGQDAEGRRTTINYFSTRASAGSESTSGVGGDAAAAQASTTTLRTVITGGGGGGGPAARDDAAARTLEDFQGVALDAEATAAIDAAIRACAARRRETDAAFDEPGRAGMDAQAGDPEVEWVPLAADAPPGFINCGELESVVQIEDPPSFTPDEPRWANAGAEIPATFLPYVPERFQAAAGPPPAMIAEVKTRPPRRRRGAAGG